MRDADTILERASELRNNASSMAANRYRVKALMNGGTAAIQALLGPHVKEQDLPWPNIMYSALTRLAQKIGYYPDVRVDAPLKGGDPAAKRAERKERVVASYDSEDRMPMQLYQVGRWLPGYGFAAWIIETRLSADGVPYPHAALRDPYDCYPSAWGVEQKPDELAVWRRITAKQAKTLFPKYASVVESWSQGHARGWSGGFVLGEGQWSSPQGQGMSVVEFYDSDGTHTLLPDIGKRVDYTPNPLESGPAFVIPKRFSFDQLLGQYDHTFGLMAAMAKINVLSIIAMQDAVMSPTDIVGDKPLGGQYRRGRNAVNVFPPGTTVNRPVANLPYQLFEQINRIERHFRVVAGYPIQDDAQSPTSWATGAGIEELQTSVNNEVGEYHVVLEAALQDLDAKRLEWDEKVSGDRSKPLVGTRKGIAYAEEYKPNTHIKGDYRTRRHYGVMAGFDESSKIVAGLQLKSAKIISRRGMQEEIHGLENLTEINEQIDSDDAREALMQGLMARTQSPDPAQADRAVMALIEFLPKGEFKTAMQKFYTPAEPQTSPEEEAMLTADPLAGLSGPGGGPPDITTVLSRLPSRGRTEGGVQTVAQV